jgi:adenylate cyclase
MADFDSCNCVLVVDDDPRILRLIALVLACAGYDALTAESGAEALVLIGASAPGLIILDLNMAPMEGETFHSLAIDSGYKGPFLVVSADMGGRIRSARMGVAYIQKPFDPSQLIDTVADLLQPVTRADSAEPPVH